MGKKFRIVETGNEFYKYRVDQKHWVFFIPYWDKGASSLGPNILFQTRLDALIAIAKAVTK